MKIKDLCKDYFWVMPKTPKYRDGAKIPYITSKNLKKGKIDYSNCKYIDEVAFLNLTTKRFIQEGDFLVSMIGTVGEVGIVRKSDLPIYGQNMYLLRPDYNRVNPKYLFYLLSSNCFHSKLLGITNGATQGYLHDKDLIEQTINEHNLNTQQIIVNELEIISNNLREKNSMLFSFDELIKSRFIGQEVSLCN